MEPASDEAWVSIDRQALEHNHSCLERRLGGSQLMAVVKADAYGHGAVEVSQVLEQRGVSWFAVAREHEARALRDSGLVGRILMLEALSGERAASARALAWTPLLSNLAQVRRWAESTSATKPPLPVHLKIDIGLRRLGLSPAELPEAVSLVSQAPGLDLEAIASHFSRSEELDGETTATEERCFRAAVEQLPSDLRTPIELHLANSCGARYRPTSRFDLVRCGGALYGLDLSADNEASSAAELRPVMSVYAPITQLRQVGTGEEVGYGGRFRARRTTTLAVLPIGYADGYTSHLSERAEVLIEQCRCPVVGAISMDRITVDVTEVADSRGVEIGTRAVLLGNDGLETISAREIASWSGDSLYEVTTRFALRMKRFWSGPISAEDRPLSS